MSYEIERAREKALGPNAQHLHQTSRASLYKVLPPAVTHLCLWSHVEVGSGKGRGGGADEDKIIFVSCLSAERYDLWCQSGAS